MFLRGMVLDDKLLWYFFGVYSTWWQITFDILGVGMVLDNKFDTHPPIPHQPTTQTHTLTTYTHPTTDTGATHTNVDMWGHVAGVVVCGRGGGHVEGFRPTVGMA